MRNFRNRPGLVGLVIAALALPLAACDLDEVLEVVDPDRVTPNTLDDPAVIDVVVAGAIGDFQVGYSGDGGDAFVSSVGAITDELYSTGTFTTRTVIDRRNLQTPANGNTSDGAYGDLQRARRALMRAAEKVADVKGASAPEYSELTALHAFTYVALAEGWCAYVPISDDTSEDPADGPPLSGVQLLEQAVGIVDGGAAGTNLGAIAKGRALLDLGRFSEAAAAVAGVPTDWNYFIEHSSTDGRQYNPLYALQTNGRWSISHNEGGNGNGVAFRGAGDGTDPAQADPRLPWYEDPAGGFDAQFRLFVSDKYPDFGSNVVLASGIEARLIEAEAALQGGGDWLGILNDLRADVAALMGAQIDSYAPPSTTLDPLTDPGSDAARVDLLFAERALWLWGTGHRLGDMRRLVNNYGRSSADVYPSGAYHKGGDHGDDVVFSVEFEEVNNILFSPDGTYPSQCSTTSTAYQ